MQVGQNLLWIGVLGTTLLVGACRDTKLQTRAETSKLSKSVTAQQGDTIPEELVVPPGNITGTYLFCEETT